MVKIFPIYESDIELCYYVENKMYFVTFSRLVYGLS